VTWISAPTLGKIVQNGVSVGQSVVADQPLFTEQTVTNERYLVRAPVSGIVATLNAPKGAWVSYGTPLLAIVNPTRYRVTANIPETAMKDLWIGQTAVIRLPADPGKPFGGHVVRIGAATRAVNPAVLSASTAFSKAIPWIPVTLTIQAPHTALWLGENATVEIRRKGS